MTLTAGDIVVHASHRDHCIANVVVVLIINHAFYPMVHLKDRRESQFQPTLMLYCLYNMLVIFFPKVLVNVIALD